MKNTISFIIPALNEEKNIYNLLRSLKDQKLNGKFAINEIVLVDNGSKDRTMERARAMNANVYSKPNLTIGGLRNFGATNSTGEILAFFDADNILKQDALVRLVDKLMDEKIGAICAHLQPDQEATWVERAWYCHLKPKGTGLSEINFLYSGGFAIRRNVFFEVGGFNENLAIGEDTEISIRIRDKGYRIFIDTDSVVYNTGYPKTIFQFVKDEFWHGDSLKTLLIHKNVDILTLYFLFCLLMLAMLCLSLLGILPSLYSWSTLMAVVLPSFIKALKKRGEIDILFVQLMILYMVYIIIRSAALLKIKSSRKATGK